MTLEERIKFAKKKGYTLKKIGIIVNRSAERVRQILAESELKNCEKHNYRFGKVCPFCEIEKDYDIKIKNRNFGQLVRLVKRFRHSGRDRATIIKKVLLINLLKSKFNLSDLQIAELFDNDPSTINHLSKKIL